MAIGDFKARPSEVSMDPRHKGGEELYPAPVVNPFDSNYPPSIGAAFKDEKGDVIFSTGGFDFFVLPKGGKEAYKLTELGYSGGDGKLHATLATGMEEKKA